jgi:hypothetical protein
MISLLIARKDVLQNQRGNQRRNQLLNLVIAVLEPSESVDLDQLMF